MCDLMKNDVIKLLENLNSKDLLGKCKQTLTVYKNYDFMLNKRFRLVLCVRHLCVTKTNTKNIIPNVTYR